MTPTLCALHLARCRLGSACLLFALAFAPALAQAACTLNVQPVVLGEYDFLDTQPLTGVGHITVNCDVATSYTISLSPGGGTYATRLLGNGGHHLAYNLYTDATYTMVWGDGSNGTNFVSGNGASDDHPVYAIAPAGQNPYVGTYSDAITVTLVF